MKYLRDYFHFPKCDRNAILALGCIAVFSIGVLMVCDALKSREGDSASSEDSLRNDALQSCAIDKGSADVRLRAFDPNTVDSLTLISFGLAPYKVKNFIHYRRAGKKFYSAADMRKTYGWTDDDIERLMPYIKTGSAKDTDNKNLGRERMADGRKGDSSVTEAGDCDKRHSDKFTSLTKVDVNLADSATLRRIPGVGEKICNAIITYRKRLGGIHSTEQLLDISIVSPELLEWFTVDKQMKVKKININTASFQVLNSHPYISYEQTRDFLKYRRLYGRVENENSLLNTGIFSREDIDRLREYLEY